ncbi:probable plastid-lipid-associated protein 14, chloroplastic isoform X2 [Tripterygium wilfordii]|uniref:probable plastid-lipid-associated protein 14, chloroplastic isoform X2 n=1 Tax=Tripterygium wilfordii TaxID=458696 RepID=UPI0018F7F3F0|nr:probable plastid-lipid-associated protein 14, chloroplastic isoform X2 [Tripterygium wilfordii]
MALCGIAISPSLEISERWGRAGNPSIGLVRSSCRQLNLVRRRSCRLQCSSSRNVIPLTDEEEDPGTSLSLSVEQESGHVLRFKMSDFKILNRVSSGLGGRGDEIVFEAMVENFNSPLYNTIVVLRQLTSAQAQRRGKRAIEVLKKLAHRRLMYHSYSMQVHGYVSSSAGSDCGSFTLVHGYHGSFSLRHWLQQSDWLPTLEATLALDEESVKRVGDDTVGGPAVTRQLRIIRILMRDLLIGVNYLHSHGLAHTELRLENVHISPVDRHIKVGILGNAADFYEVSPNSGTLDNVKDRRQLMIAFDMRCVGFMMAKMVLQELMDPLIFTKFKSFLVKGNDPSCLREFILPILSRDSPSGNAGLQILDRNWGAGWNLLSLLLASKPSKRISCLDALRHPFLCGPRWRVVPSMDIIRWGLGSTAVRITEEYIYRRPQNWLELLPGKWRLLYCTGRHIGLTLRQPSARVLIDDVHLTISRTSDSNASFSFTSDIGYRVMIGKDWPHDKTGIAGNLHVISTFRLTAGRRLYLKEEKTTGRFSLDHTNTWDFLTQKLSGRKWRKVIPFEEVPSSLPVARLVSSDIEVTMILHETLNQTVVNAQNVVQEVRTQLPPEMFDLSKLVCGTYVDSRLLVLRGVNGSALLFYRSSTDGY